MGIRVKATKLGYDGTQFREPGDEFAAPLDRKGKPITKSSWYVPVGGRAAKAEDKSKREEPVAEQEGS